MDFRYNCFNSYFSFGIRPIRSFPFHLTMGVIVGILDETHSEWVEIYPAPPPRERDFKSSDFQSGFISSLSYQLNRINLEFMYERTNGISNYLNLGGNVNRYHFLVRYNLFSKEE